MCGSVRYEAGGESAASVREMVQTREQLLMETTDSLPLHRLPQDWWQHLQHQRCLRRRPVQDHQGNPQAAQEEGGWRQRDHLQLLVCILYAP